MKHLRFLTLILSGVWAISLHSSCVRGDAQVPLAESRITFRDIGRCAGPDGNPATYDEDPENLPQSQVRTYINTNGVEVQSPTVYKAPPPDACAICIDDTYSQSKHRRGTCSGHGGVKEWLKEIR